MSLIEVAKWNYDRNNLVYNAELEEAMLQEEEAEFADAFKMYLDMFDVDNSDEQVTEAVVDMVDALADYQYVFYGTVCKGLGVTRSLPDNKHGYMVSILQEILITHNVTLIEHGKIPLLERCFREVIKANNEKPFDSTSGKVLKGANWKDPKVAIKAILFEAGFIANRKEGEAKLMAELLDKATKKQVAKSIDELDGKDFDDE